MFRTLVWLAAVGLLLASATLQAAPVQWTVASGGNGHYYEAVNNGSNLLWTTANTAAEAAAVARGNTYGNDSYLVAVNTAAESSYVFSLINNSIYWHDAWKPYWSAGPWNGAIQPPGSPEPDGGWMWTSGEPMTYTNWGHGTWQVATDQQPNDGHGGELTEDRACFYNYSNPGATNSPPPGPYWCDLSYVIPTSDQFCPKSYVIEYVSAGVTWKGTTSTTWSTATGTSNWKKTSDSTAIDYANAAAVIFDDSATGSLTANIGAADVSPASVVFNNSTNAYVVSGTKGIVGAAAVLKQGAAKVTLGSVNSYTGVTTVEAGTLQFNGAAARNPVVNLGGANLKAGKLIFDYTGESDPATTIGTLLTTSYHSGSASHFDLGKFQSSTADTNHGLGWIENMSQQVLVAYTLYGDATLNGGVDISDLSALGQNWNGAGKVWAQGDFNYDGKVDISDLSALGQHWNQSIPGFSGGIGSESGAAVPEPSSCVLLGIGALGLLAHLWRRRKQAASGVSN